MNLYCSQNISSLIFSEIITIWRINFLPIDLGSILVDLYPKLLRYALSQTKSKDTAEDLVMDVIKSMLERQNQFDDSVNFEAYAIRAVKNRYTDSKRYRARNITETEMGLDEKNENFFSQIADEASETAAFAKIQFKELSNSLVALGEECLEILTLYGIGNSYKEIAEISDKKIGTVMSRMSRCREQLKIKMGEDTQ